MKIRFRYQVGLLCLVLVGSLFRAGAAGPVGAVEAIGPPDDGVGVWLEDGVGYSDIDGAGVHRANVETLAGRGVFEGTECAPGRFCPKDPIPRWVMAVWLVRTVEESAPAAVESSRFVDVDSGEWWLPYVERLADLGITRGCAVEPARFCPFDPVNREQMASFLVRAFRLEPAEGNEFADVAGGNAHLADINALAGAGVTAGCATDPDRYCPGRDTTRAQMATFLARSLGIDRQPAPEDTTTEPPGEPPPGDFTAVSAGASHTCGLLADGAITCWGANNERQAEPPQGAFTAVTSGWAFSCGLRTDGSISCWGAGSSDQTDAPQGPFTAVSAGGWHVCGIRPDRSVACWGDNDHGQSGAPAGEFTAVASGYDFSCGLRTDRTVTCWGDNREGQTDGPTGEFSTLESGAYHSCAIDADQVAICWGGNGWGQADVPARTFTHLVGGWLHTCGVRTDQTVTCWGYDRKGQSSPPGGKFTALTAGNEHSCGLLTGGSVTCWGGDLGDRNSQPSGEFTHIASGRSHSCGLRPDGTVFCWGTNSNRQVEPPDGEFSALAVGDYHSCGIRTDRKVICWGADWDNQSSPPAEDFVVVAGGWAHSCGVRADGTIRCWGNNQYGQSDGPGGEFSSVSAGWAHACAIGIDRTVVCWGDSRNGKIDAPSGGFERIAAGESHTCGLRTSGAINCWGGNWEGQTEAPAGEFIGVSAGRDHSCGLASNRSIRCWGDNDEGESQPPPGQFSAVTSGRSYSCGLDTDGTVSCWGRDLVLPAPVDVRHFAALDHPDLQMCRPPGTNGTTAGFPLPHDAAPAVGAANVAVLFIDFPDAAAAHSTRQEADLGLPYMQEYLEAASYRQFEPRFAPLHRWLRAEHNYAHYLDRSVLGLRVSQEIVGEAVRLADPEFDFRDMDSVMVVMPSSHFGGGTAGGRVSTDEGTVWNAAWVNNFPLDEPGDPRRWGSTGAHELMHNLGLTDLYPYDQNRHEPPYRPAGIWAEAEFGLMGLDAYFQVPEDDPRLAYRVAFPNGQRQTDFGRRLEAAEMLAWSRWQLGWLRPGQIHCVAQLEAETTITIGPVASPGNEAVMIAIPVSETEVIVIESRRKLGYDTGRQYQWPDGARTTLPGLPDEGVLVYTVNASLESGRLPIRVAGDPGNGHLEGHPILAERESVTIGRYTITVQASTNHTDTVTIARAGPR